MSTKFFTNRGGSTVLDKFKEVFDHADIEEFDALVEYFRSTGYFRLRPSLDGVRQIRILVGINADPIIRQYQARGADAAGDAKNNEHKKIYLDQFVEEIHQADYVQELEQSVIQFIEDIASGRLQIRVHPSRRLHPKIYIFRPENFNGHGGGEVITGSSNLTEAALGIDESGFNYEFNVTLRDRDDIQFATEEFEELWQEGEEFLPVDFVQAKDTTFLRGDLTPYQLYLKFLMEYFDERIEFNPDNAMELPPGYKRLNYQFDAVEQGLGILKKHNGVFLADVVGLGKTVIAIMLARRLCEQDVSSQFFRALIVAPPAIMASWEETVDEFELSFFDLISSGSLHKVKDARKYNLIIIDEAHKFRNKNSGAYELMQNICKTETKFGGQKKVVLLSATPLNNRPDDILNQLLLFQDGSRSTLECGNLNGFFAPINREYRYLLNNSSEPGAQERVAKIYERVRREVLEPITVRRTRRDLQDNRFYSEDLKRQGISFPNSNAPENLLYELPNDLNQLYDETLERIAGKNEDRRLNYARHRMIAFLNDEHKKDYARAELISEMLMGIMKTLMVKRLDSSFNAIYQTLKRFLKSSQVLLRMCDNDRIYLAPSVKVADYVEQEREDELIEILSKARETDPGVKILRRSDFSPKYWRLVEEDHRILENLVGRWKKVIDDQIDPKRDRLVQIMRTKLFDKAKNPEQKLVIFSESLDTTNDLAEQLRKKGFKKILNVNSSTREKLKDKIKENFDTNLSDTRDPRRSDYDIIITTEVLSEGVNLHRANIIVNYDTPWNSTKLMQRIGRINRIGSRAEEIFIYNFLPTEKVEGDINLKHRASVKLQAFHSALGEDSQIFLPDEQVGSFGLFEKDVTLDNEVSKELHYLQVIRSFREEHPEEFERIRQMPAVKIRGGVANAQYQGGTFVFLRNAARQESFVMAVPEEEKLKLSKLTFLESAKILECEPAVLPTPLHADHYRQVRKVLSHFKEEAERAISEMAQTSELTSQQERAIKYLSELQDVSGLSWNDKDNLDQAIQLIQRDRFPSLTRKINQLRTNSARSSISDETQFRWAADILKEYPVYSAIESDEDELQQSTFLDVSPGVVIAQSYS